MPSPIEDVYPLAPLQQGMLFHTLEAPAAAAGAYWAQEVSEYTIEPLDVDALRRAWELVMERHPVLRTRFVWEGVPAPLQVVQSGLPVPFERLDWSDGDDAEQQARLEKLLAADRDRGFDLTAPPLMRVYLVARGAHRYWMVWTFHHICMDGWSIPVVLDEVQHAYDRLADGQRPDLPPARPYRDFIQWVAGRDPLAARQFWRNHLAGLEAPTPLPVDRAAAAHWQQDTAQIELPDQTTDRLVELGRRARVTPSTIVQAAWALVLSRYSGQYDVTFGLTVSGRPAELSGMESMVGLFINTLPMRAVIRPDEPFDDWLRRLQDTQLEMQRFDHTPLADIQKAAQLPPGVSLFDSIIAFQNLPEGDLDDEQEDDAEGRTSAVDAFAAVEQARYPLMFSVEMEGHLSLGVQFSTAAFERATIERLLEQVGHVLTAVVEAPHVRVRDVPMHSKRDRHRIVVDWNEHPPQTFTQKTLTELFKERVAAAPGSRAILCAGEDLTYAELGRRANRVAGWLRRNGVRPQDRVGLCFDRGVEFVIAVLGTVEAGACYVPLVPSQPEARLRYMIETSDIGVVVTGAERPAGLGGTGVRLLDFAEADDGGEAAEIGDTGTRPHSALYVMYTSGSTGAPKGVEVTHQGVARVCRDQVVEIPPDDVISHMVPISFDASTFEIWGALLNGATLAIATPAELERIDLVSILRRNKVTVAVITTGLFHQAAELAPEVFETLRMLLVGGDAMSSRHARKVKERLPGLRVINAYGPTETTIAGTMFDVDRGLPDGEESVPIGGPLVGSRVYVLDEWLNVVPVGVPGELFIGGAGVARGYVKRPDLTAERFVPDPVGGVPGERLYRTGDLARWRPDGVLEFLGRVDEQVKIRGFRIELGEVRAALVDHPGVRDAVVVVHEDETTGKRLVAYIVGEPDGPTTAELRSHLLGRLPGYMVPALFMAVDVIPLTEHGKVDRAALPEPTATGDETVEYVPPRTEVERVLAEIWAQVLQVERVGVHDSFFALGGDSMLSLQIVARARKAGLELGVADVFTRQTVAELASVASTGPVTIQAEQGAVSGPVPLVPVQRWFVGHGIGARDHWNWSGTFELRPDVDGRLLGRVVDALVAHHDALRMRLAYDADRREWVQHNAAAEAAEVYTVVDAAGRAERVLEELVTRRMEDAQRSLDLAYGPLLRVLFFDRGDEPAWLGITVHHLVVDLLSWNVLLEDLHHAYEALAADVSPEEVLGPKTTSFKEWAEELASFAASDDARAELPYWRSQLEPGFSVPLDRDGPNTEASRASEEALLDPESAAALLTRVHRVYGTRINDFLLAALAQVLAGWSGSGQVSIGLENHGRHPIADGIDLSRTVGWFTSIHPVALGVADLDDPGALLTSVRDRLRAVPGGGVGFGALRYLAPEDEEVRALRALPDPQVVFNYAGGFDAVEDEAVGLVARELPDELNGLIMTEEQDRPYVLQIEVARTGDGALSIEWGYSRDLHRPETIAHLAHEHVTALRRLIEHCLNVVGEG